MWVCALIRPGSPVYLEKSIVSAPAGIAEGSVVTARILPLSTTTIAFVQTLPLASHSLPKRTALTFCAPGFSWARTRVDTNTSSAAIAIRDTRMSTTLPREVQHARWFSVLIQFCKECKRDSQVKSCLHVSPTTKVDTTLIRCRSKRKAASEKLLAALRGLCGRCG